VDELVNNAIEHGATYRRHGSDLSLDVGIDGGRVTIDFVDPEMPEDLVRDLATALRDAAGGMPSLDSERGRGLFLVAIHMDELRVDVASGGGLHLFGRLAEG
jgi:anti-sigma regulatory factor (Ser/Thr protein kinase)